MKTFLAALAITVALTGAADATKFDTSKMSVDDKNTLVVVIYNYYYNGCSSSNGMTPKLKAFYNQLLSEMDTQSTSMAEARKAVEQERNRFHTQWCPWAINHLQNWEDQLLELPPPPPPPEPEPPTPVDLAHTAEGRAAFYYVSLQRHEATCPMARSQAFEMARTTMLDLTSKNLAGISPEVMTWAGKQFDKEVGSGMVGPWCRKMTAAITDYQSLMFE